MKKIAFKKDVIVETAVDTGTSVAGAGAGLLIAGPPGAILGAVITPVANSILKRFLTNREKGRIQKVVDLANKKFQENIDKGAGMRKDLDKKQFQELSEGLLLKAKDMYEEKKIPLVANLLAAAPFTNTPLVNMNQTLIYAEQLSYRQICLIAIIGNGWREKIGLTNIPLSKQDKLKHHDEMIEGVYSDLNHLIVLGLIGQILAKNAGPAIASGMFQIAPAYLDLLYPGRLLYNGLQLGMISDDELDLLIKILS